MIDAVPVVKDEENQRPVPSIWRNTFSDIVEAFKEGDFVLERGVVGVRPISMDDAGRIAGNIQTYGYRLTSLSEEAWQTSTCQWMRSYWDVLVDLFTIEEGPSDLVLVARIFEEGLGYVFEIHSVHVP